MRSSLLSIVSFERERVITASFLLVTRSYDPECCSADIECFECHKKAKQEEVRLRWLSDRPASSTHCVDRSWSWRWTGYTEPADQFSIVFVNWSYGRLSGTPCRRQFWSIWMLCLDTWRWNPSEDSKEGSRRTMFTRSKWRGNNQERYRRE